MWIINISILINYFQFFDKLYIGISAFLAIILISFFGFLFGNLLFIKNISISTNKISNNCSFIFITDIHLGTNSIKHLKNIFNKIKNINYDFILIGGDLIDSSSFDIEELSIFKNIKKPIFFVTGNHEYYIKNFKSKLDFLDNVGITLLNNEKYQIDKLNIIGIDDNQNKLDKEKHTLSLINKDSYNLLLVHKPSIWANVRNQVDLMLSGHTHNGQIFPFNFFVKMQFKFKYGMYKYNNSKLFVSSGSACWGPRIRIGSCNEIVHFNLTK